MRSPSKTRNAIVTAMDVWGVARGDAREAAKLFLVIHLLMTVAFIMTWRASMRAADR
jgi:hypothetical protein